MTIKLIELFSGIGSQIKALTNLGIDVESVGISEWSINALIAYNLIHCKNISVPIQSEEIMHNILNEYTFSLDGKNVYDTKQLNTTKLTSLYNAHIATKNMGSITDIKTLPPCNLLTYSFPCQDISTQGKGEGLTDGKHSSLVWEVGRILNNLEHLPDILLMENVPAILSAKYNFESWKTMLTSLGYKNSVYNIKASMCDIPQNRTRTFMISSIDDEKIINISKLTFTKKTINDILRTVDVYKFPVPHLKLVHTSQVPITPSGLKIITVDELSTYNSEKKIYCFDGIAPTLTATGSNSRIKILLETGLVRYLTPCECWLLMGFDEEDYRIVKNFGASNSTLIKHAGNSIVVNVLMEIFKQLYIEPIIIKTETIAISSNLLGPDLSKNIFTELETLIGTHVKEGYITEIIKLVQIHKSWISYAESTNKFKITYLARVSKPMIGYIHNGIIKGIYIHGLFVSLNNGVNVLVIKCKCNFNINDVVKFKIVELEFDTKETSYSCIAHHIC